MDDDLSYIKQVRQQLYKKNRQQKRTKRSSLKDTRSRRNAPPQEWQEEKQAPTPPPKKRTPRSYVFFLVALLFFIGAVAVAGYQFLGGGNTVSSENVALTIDIPEVASGGESVTAEVTVTNHNTLPLELSDLIVSHPARAASGDEGELLRTRESLGTIAPGESVTREYPIVLFGGQGDEKTVFASLEYRVQGSNAIFVKESQAHTQLDGAPIEIAFDGPFNMSSNQSVTLDVSTLVNTYDSNEPVRLKLRYPPGFEFEQASPEPTTGTHIWDLSELSESESQTITISGMMFGGEGDEKVFHADIGVADQADTETIDILLNSQVHTIALREPFFATTISLAERQQGDATVRAGEDIPVRIDWSNQSGKRLRNVSLEATLGGSAFSEAGLEYEDAEYNGGEQTIIWTRDTYDDFDSIPPGGSGSVSFTLSPRSAMTTAGVMNNPHVTVSVSARGVRIGDTEDVEEVTNYRTRTARIGTTLAATTRMRHFSGPFTNTGPIPPQVGAETSYTVQWELTNTANELRNVELRAQLNSFVDYTGVFDPQAADVTYNPNTRELVWQVGSLPAATGFDTSPRSLAFQVLMRPLTSHANEVPTLIDDVEVVGTDAYTGETVEIGGGVITTTLTEQGAPANHDLVQP